MWCGCVCVWVFRYVWVSMCVSVCMGRRRVWCGYVCVGLYLYVCVGRRRVWCRCVCVCVSMCVSVCGTEGGMVYLCVNVHVLSLCVCSP